MNENTYSTRWRQAARPPSGATGKARALLRNLVLSVSSAMNKPPKEPFLRCLYCHYVFDDQKQEFEYLIKELMKAGEFVDTDTCIAILEGKQALDRSYYHMSFDDGFRNNYTNALPVLKKYRIPAIFFVPSSLVDADWERARDYCLHTTHYASVVEMLKWNDLRDLLAQGYQVGSHTRTHARFSDISKDPSLMEDEILGSKMELEKNLGYECKYISWPYGSLRDVDDESLKMAKRAGYKACFGAYRGTVKPGSTHIFSIPRHHFEVQWPLSHITFFARGNMEVKS